MRRFLVFATTFAIGVVFALAAMSIQDAQRALAQEKQKLRPDQPGTDMKIYTPKLHGLYDGKYRLSCGKTYMVGGLSDKEGWEQSAVALPEPPSGQTSQLECESKKERIPLRAVRWTRERRGSR